MPNPTRARVAAVALLACAACGGTDVAVPQAQPMSAASPSASPALPAPDGELVTSEKTLPAEPAYGFADIATSAPDADRAWRRFGLAGAPPPVEEGTALLFRGLGESGSCPTGFSGLQVEGDQVRLTTAVRRSDGPGESTPTVCTSDYNPRTLVVAVPRGALPAGAFSFDGFLLSSTPLDGPPPGPSAVDSWIAGDPEVEVRSEPATVAPGGRVEALVTTGSLSASPGSWTTMLERWEGQRWLPAPGAAAQGDHPAATPAREQVPAGSTGPLAVVDTTGLAPGHYRVLTRLGLGDAEGSTGVQALFTVTG